MRIQLTRKAKTPCLLCNCMPMEADEQGTQRPLAMLHAVGVHVNWNEDANICQNCVRVMAELLGYMDKDDAKELKAKVARVGAERDEIQEAFDAQKERISQILAGKKAERRQKEAA